MERHGEVESVMAEVDISEEIPSGDDSAFVVEEPSSADRDEVHEVQTADDTNGPDDVPVDEEHHPITGEVADHVFAVATSQGYVTAEQLREAGIKTTHIVIQDHSFGVEVEPLKSPTTPLPPPTPSTPLSREKGFRYQWDDSVHFPILPIRCKDVNGELYKAKFGSGGRGKCVKSNGRWFTPSEFESFCGRASSKDWKRSIRYGGRTLQCLIEDGMLTPHATSCTCAACCDDEAVTGPIRLFVPYKRRKRESESGSLGASQLKKPRLMSTKSSSLTNSPSPTKDTQSVMAALHSQTGLQHISQPTVVTDAETGDTVQIVTTDSSGNLITAGEGTVVQLPAQVKANATQPQTQQFQPTIHLQAGIDVNEQKQWWQLEEMANAIIQQAEQLKVLIAQAKDQAALTREASYQQLKAQMEKEKNAALNAQRIEMSMNLSRAVLEERTHKDIAVQQALAQARADMQEKSGLEGTTTLVTDDKAVTYRITWADTSPDNQATMTIIDQDNGSAKKGRKT
ncbi:deformed epidermal autoregulatory factor 1 homolog [Tubulanus polymorphus]|uniref:deformed epidermal autoregulatory factor 1 homolog n=1 Tax=Tubulanus polymorphus TaxID=672921 RepID=UPI003DA3B6B7